MSSTTTLFSRTPSCAAASPSPPLRSPVLLLQPACPVSVSVSPFPPRLFSAPSAPPSLLCSASRRHSPRPSSSGRSSSTGRRKRVDTVVEEEVYNVADGWTIDLDSTEKMTNDSYTTRLYSWNLYSLPLFSSVIICKIGPTVLLKSLESITANELAGLGVGALLLAAALATPKVDAFIARAQRRELKLCEECGGVTRIPCSRCRARGTLTEGVFGSSKAVTCSACRGKGNFPCPRCCVNNKSSSSSSSSSSFVWVEIILCRQWPRYFAINAAVLCAISY